MQNTISCPFCSEHKISKFHEKLRYAHPEKIYKCNNCSFVFLYPRLSSHEQTQYYATQYRDEYKDNTVEQRFISDLFEAQLRLKRIIPCFPKEKSLLEVGSGSGAFLSIAAKNFDKVIGVELDIPSCTFLKSKGLTVYSTIEELKNEKFDVIVMFHVLEHLLDPVTFLKDLSDFLNKNGCIIIEVPSVDDALVSFYNINAFKDFYFCSAHVSYFSSKTLRDCFESANLKGDISHIQRYDLNNHLHWLMHQCPGTLSKDKQIFSNDTLKQYEKDLSDHGINDTLWAVVTK